MYNTQYHSHPETKQIIINESVFDKCTWLIATTLTNVTYYLVKQPMRSTSLYTSLYTNLPGKNLLLGFTIFFINIIILLNFTACH